MHCPGCCPVSSDPQPSLHRSHLTKALLVTRQVALWPGPPPVIFHRRWQRRWRWQGEVSLLTLLEGLSSLPTPGTQSRKRVLLAAKPGGWVPPCMGRALEGSAVGRKTFRSLKSIRQRHLSRPWWRNIWGAGVHVTAVPGTAAAPPPEQPTQGHQHVPSGSREPSRGRWSLCRG